jgi:hypothetical protein
MNITLPQLYEAQIPIIKDCLADDVFYVIVNGGRQCGKTLIAKVAAIYWALNEPNSHICVVSPTDSQVLKIQKEILEILKPAQFLLKNVTQSSGNSSIGFKNNSKIIFRSAKSKNSLRGYSNTHLILDETAFMDEDTYNEVLAPSLAVRGKKVLFCSTPKGKNFFAKLYYKGQEKNDGYRSHKLIFYNNPYANLKFIQSQKEQLTEEIFAQEYLGEFIDASGVFKNIDELAVININNNNSKKSIFIGVDIAFKNDYTVAVAVNENGEMIDYIRFNKVDTDVLLKNLTEFFKKFTNLRKIIIEENNQGLPIIHNLRSLGIKNIEEFQTNSKSKNEIVNALIYAFGKKEIKIINEEVVIDEFKAFGFEMTASMNIKYSAMFGHDDIVMATLFAWKAYKTGNITRPTMFAR